MKIDSTLTVKDSVRLKSKLTVDQKAVFKQNVVVKGQLLRAYHNAKINNNLTVNNKLTVDGVTKLQGIVKLLGISQINQQALQTGNYTILLKQQNGNVVEVPPAVFGFEVPNPPVSDENPCSNYTSNIYQAAGWAFNEGTHKIYAGCAINNVGIGTYNPTTKLDVKGTAKMTENLSGKLRVGYRFYHPYTTDALINGIAITPTQDIIELGSVNSSNQVAIKFRVTHDGTVIMTPKNNAHAFVAYNDAGDKIIQLENNGLLRSREIKVEQIAWPDYVFEKNYKMISIEQIAKYILKYKHLPGVPSAQKIKAEGLSLGKMQTILMQKIEELTLYTIEQNTQIKDLEKNVTTLEKENQQLKSDLQQVNDRLDKIEAMLNHK